MKYFFIFAFFIFINSNTKAQAFSLDTTFNLNYNFYAPWGDIDPAIYGLNFEPDGKLIFCGNFCDNTPNGYGDILRIYDDGSIDTSCHALSYGSGNPTNSLYRLNNINFVS